MSNDTEQNNGWLWKEIFIYFMVFLFSCGLIACGYFLETESSSRTLRLLFTHLFNEVGTAGVVAIGLALTVDRLAKWRFIELAEKDREKVKKDVFQYVYGYKIPSEITSEIDSQILRSLFIRRNCKLIYSIKKIQDENDEYFLLVDATISYDLENVTTEPKTYLFEYFIEESPSPSLNSMVKFKELEIKKCENPISYNEEKIQQKTSSSKVPGRLGFESSIEVRVLPDNPASVVLKYDMIRLSESESNFTTLIPTIGLDWKIVLEDDSRLQLDCYDPSPEGIAFGNEHQLRPEWHHWSLQRPLLPNQGVYLRWSNK